MKLQSLMAGMGHAIADISAQYLCGLVLPRSLGGTEKSRNLATKGASTHGLAVFAVSC